MTRSDSDDALVRAALVDDLPFLGQRCPEAQARMYDYSVEIREGIDPPKREGLKDAALALLTAVHEALSPLENLRLDPGPAFEVFYAKRWAVRALQEFGTKMDAKRAEMSVSDDRPLTVCTGPHKTAAIPTVLGPKHMPLYWAGCHLVFPDSTNSSGGGRCWKDWCPDCTPKRRQPARALAARHAKYVGEFEQRRTAGSR